MFDVKTSRNELFNLQIPQNLQDWINSLIEEFGTKRQDISNNCRELTKMLHMAVKYEVFGVALPIMNGGLNLNFKQQHYYFKFLSQISGTFAFFSTQFSTALTTINSGNNDELKKLLLKKGGLANTFIGLATNHLKNFKKPMVNGYKKDSKYVINGSIRYVSGYQIFNKLILGFVCDNEEVFALVPFCEGKSFSIQPQINLITANSTNTVNCILDNYEIDEELIISKIPLGSVNGIIGKSTRNIVSFQIGLAYSIMDLVHNNPYLQIPIVLDAYNRLATDLLTINQEMADLPKDASVIPLRIRATLLLNQIFFFSDQIFKGAGTLDNTPYVLIKNESQIIGAIASSEDTLIESCRYILNN